MKKKFWKAGPLCIFLIALLAFPLPADAVYSEQIAASLPEVYEALQRVMSKTGIEKEDPARGVMVSRWQEDTVKRERQIPFSGSVSKSYARRYRITASLKQEGRFIRLEISAVFQYRPADAARTAPWRDLKNIPDERETEKNFFLQVLSEMAASRKSSA